LGEERAAFAQRGPSQEVPSCPLFHSRPRAPEGSSANGRYVGVDGKQYLSFGSCSYMSLETRPELRDAAHDAIDRWGTQFHFSRVYVQWTLYEELESCLASMTGRPTLVVASTSSAHMAALPVVVADFEALKQLLDAHPKLRLSIDDAHGTSWTGVRGREFFLEYDRERRAGDEIV
jgi:7-keto-8-aminopelargonate synthetase-like enzyme